MRFKVISVGWRCADFWQRTLDSIAAQDVDNFDVAVVYDGGDDAGPAIADWCGAQRCGTWHVQLNADQRFVVRNQLDALRVLDPADDDIVVFVDLDGDQLAHPHVLARLADEYADGTLLTYGSYRPAVPTGGMPRVVPFPPDVVATGTYRKHILHVECCFNHLRTMAGRVATAIPAQQFQWTRGPHRGSYYKAGADYIFMVAGLELAGGRYKAITEELLIYNNTNPLADNVTHPRDTDACVQDFLRRRRPLAPLAPLTPAAAPPATTGRSTVFLSADERRAVLRDYGTRHQLRVFIETGTNDGETPWQLRDAFDRLITIELGHRQWRAAVDRFANVPHVECLHGDSGTVLPKVLADVDQPALIWLDGHYSGPGTARGGSDTPVLAELDAIFATGIPHVVLVDDARIFGGMSHAHEHDWPHIDQVHALAQQAGYTFEVVDDIIRLTP